MQLERYRQELASAEATGRLERPACWQASRHGLQRESFGEPVVRERGQGYRDGYAMGIEATGSQEE